MRHSLAFGLVLGAWVTAALADPVVSHGPRSGSGVALTFDACNFQGTRYDAGVIAALRETQAPATLFLSGRWVEKFPETARALTADPLFEIGMHGYTHRNPVNLTRGELKTEFARAAKTFQDILGLPLHLYRPPYAVHNPTVVEVAHEEKVVVVEYDIASGDSDKTLSEDAVLKDLMEKIRPGSIVIFHMNGNGVHTASLIRRLVPWLRKQGLKPVTVGALVKHDLGHPGADKSR